MYSFDCINNHNMVYNKQIGNWLFDDIARGGLCGAGFDTAGAGFGIAGGGFDIAGGGFGIAGGNPGGLPRIGVGLIQILQLVLIYLSLH